MDLPRNRFKAGLAAAQAIGAEIPWRIDAEGTARAAEAAE